MPDLKPADLELLSAYLDDALLPEERAALEARLLAEPALRAELDALRAVVDQVRALPVLTAPRDFRLDPAIYGQKAPSQPVRVSRQRAASRAYYRWGSALSAVAAAITLVIGVLGLLGPQYNGAAVLQEAVQMDDGAARQMTEQIAPPSAIAVLPTLAVTPQSLTGRGAEAPGGLGGAADSAGAGSTIDTEPDAPPVIPLEALEDAAEDGMTMQNAPEAEVFAAEPAFEGEAPAAAEDSATAEDSAASSDLAAASGLAEEEAAEPATAFGMGGGGATLPPPAAEALQADAAAQAAPAESAVGQSTKSLAPTLPVTEIALLPSPTAVPTQAMVEAPSEAEQQATTAESAELEESADEAPPAAPVQTLAVEDRTGPRLDPGMFIGASVILLALAATLFALSRRR